MNPTINTEEIRTILRNPSQDATRHILHALGWQGEGASVDRPMDAPRNYARLMLGTAATSAGTQLTSATNLWWTGFQQGASYHIAVDNRSICWYDFQNRMEWRADYNDDLSPLAGLTPQAFIRNGIFAPAKVAPIGSDTLPTKPPRPYLIGLVKSWLEAYVKSDERTNVDGPLAESDFVVLLARLVFIRTIEDIGVADWHRSNTLLHLTESTTGINRRLTELFGELHRRLQNPMFSKRVSLPAEEGMTVQLIRYLYNSGGRSLDFSAIDFSMVGQFYEVILGDHLVRTQSRQTTMFGASEATVVPVSHRREFGQYYTPRVYSDYLAQKLVLPRVLLSQTTEDLPVVADLAVGSGEMLTATLRAILSVPAFNNPEAVCKILSTKLVGFDTNPTAIQLATLNLLRTAYLICPELLATGSPLPNLSRIQKMDTLSKNHLKKGVDIVLTNPPFRGQPDWFKELPQTERKVGLMQYLGGKSNKADAFLIRSIEALKAGGRLGIVMPTQFFTSSADRKLRSEIVATFTPTELVINHGAKVFDGVDAQPSLLIGDVATNNGVRSPNTLVRTVAPTTDSAETMARVGVPAAPARLTIVKAPTTGEGDWLFREATFLRKFSGPTCQVGRYDGVGLKFSRSPILHVKPLGETWKLRLTNRCWRVESTRAEIHDVEASTHILRPVHPGQIEPSATQERIIYPYDVTSGKPKVIRLSEWLEKDPVIFSVLRAACDSASSRRSLSNTTQEQYRLDLEKERPKYFRDYGYVPPDNNAVLVIGRVPHVPIGAELWPFGVARPKARVIPLSGNFSVFATEIDALLFGVILNTPPIFDQLRALAPSIGPGAVEVSAGLMKRLWVPSFHDRSKLSDRVSEGVIQLRSSMANWLLMKGSDEYVVPGDAQRKEWASIVVDLWHGATK